MKLRRNLQDWRHVLGMILAMAIISGGLIFVFLHINFMPNPSSLEAGDIERFVKILFSIASVFFSVVIVGLVHSLLFFRQQRDDNTDGPSIRGYRPLEIVWVVIPLAVVIGLAYYGAVVLDKMGAPGPPQTEMEIDVLAFRYGWQFTYPEYNVTSFDLQVPVNQRILIKLQSKDVVHSFWVPEWGPKQDAVPGITTQIRYTPTRIGQFTLYCSQLCGPGHSYMTAPVIVESSSGFQAWIQQQKSQHVTPQTSTTTSTSTTIPMTFQTLATQGKAVYSNSCAACHGTNGGGGIGPALWGSNASLGTYNGVNLFDKNAQSLLNFISGQMPLSAPGSLTAQQYTDVLAYILLQDNQVSPSNSFNEGQLSEITLK